MNRLFAAITIVGGCVIAVALGIVLFASFSPAARTSATDGGESTAAIASRLHSDAPAPQQPALVDATISLAEYSAAVDATVACALAAGVKITVLPADGAAPPSFAFQAPDLAEGERIRGVLDGCKTIHFNAIQELWNAQHRPSPEEAAASIRWMANCVSTAGFAGGTSHPTAKDLSAWATSSNVELAVATGECIDRHYRTFGYWP